MFRNQQPIDFASVNEPRAAHTTQQAAGKDITNYVIAGLLVGIIIVAAIIQHAVASTSLF